MIGALKDFDFSKVQEVFGLTPFTSMWNTTGQPASSVPAGFDELGLPVGVQLVGRPWDEVTVIRVERAARVGAALGASAPVVVTHQRPSL